MYCRTQYTEAEVSELSEQPSTIWESSFDCDGNCGVLARDILQVVLREAEQSIASGDGERMKRSLESLRNVPQ
jgi:hypothetical protein